MIAYHPYDIGVARNQDCGQPNRDTSRWSGQQRRVMPVGVVEERGTKRIVDFLGHVH